MERIHKVNQLDINKLNFKVKSIGKVTFNKIDNILDSVKYFV